MQNTRSGQQERLNKERHGLQTKQIFKLLKFSHIIIQNSRNEVEACLNACLRSRVNLHQILLYVPSATLITN